LGKLNESDWKADSLKYCSTTINTLEVVCKRDPQSGKRGSSEEDIRTT